MSPVVLGERFIQMKYSILTNNPLVNERFSSSHEVDYKDVNAKDILRTAEGMISDGYTLLNHPLYGSVKPNETPYRSLLMTRQTSAPAAISCDESQKLILKARTAYEKFTVKKGDIPADVLYDYQVVDLDLASTAVQAADR